MRVVLDYIAAQDPAAQVAVFHNDSPFGTAPLADGRAVDQGQGLPARLQGVPDEGRCHRPVGLLQQAKAQGAKYVVIQNVSSPAAVVAHDIAAQKLDMKIVCLNWCSDELFVKTAGDAAEGHLMVQPFAPPSAGKPGHQEVRQYCQSKGIDLDDQGPALRAGLVHDARDGQGHRTGPHRRQGAHRPEPAHRAGNHGRGGHRRCHRPDQVLRRKPSGQHRLGHLPGLRGGKLTEVTAGVAPKQ